MKTSWKHVVHQGPVIAAFGRTVASALRTDASASPPTAPGPELSFELPPRPDDLVDAYVRATGGDPAAYTDTIPPHLFPQWGLGPASHTLRGMPYPVAKAVNGGCRFTLHAPIPRRAPLRVTARLESLEDDGKRVIIEQRIQTWASGDLALDATLVVVIPLPRDPAAPKTSGAKKPRATVPDDATELARLDVSRSTALDFAKLTGDFNPIHWVPVWARASGFKNTILHGFATAAHAIEATQRTLFDGRAEVRAFECRFTRPLTLPANVGVYAGTSEDKRPLWVADNTGTEPFMAGSFSTSPTDR